jgi:hypothetical protein
MWGVWGEPRKRCGPPSEEGGEIGKRRGQVGLGEVFGSAHETDELRKMECHRLEL